MKKISILFLAGILMTCPISAANTEDADMIDEESSFIADPELSGESAPDDLNTIKVLVEVVGDPMVSADVEKYLKEVLDHMEDVVVVDSAPDVYIHAICRVMITNTGNRLGYVMTTASSEIMDVELSDGSNMICSDYSGLWLEVGPDISSLCSQCALAINSGVLNNIRARREKDVLTSPSAEQL